VIYVERSEVRQALEAQLPVFHRSMHEQHIKLDHLEIQDFSSQLTHQDHSQLAGNKEKPTTTQSETLQNRAEQNKNKYSNLAEKNMRRKRNFGYNSLELTV